MSPEYQSVRARLKELRENTGLLKLPDFQPPGVSGNDVAECIDQMESEGIIKRAYPDHKTSINDSGVDLIIIRITAHGRQALSEDW